MREKIQSLLEELWAKDDGTTIREHTEKLLKNLDEPQETLQKRNRGSYPKGVTCGAKRKILGNLTACL
jgi:CRISPR-associated endonuclease/helicase Cas3